MVIKKIAPELVSRVQDKVIKELKSTFVGNILVGGFPEKYKKLAPETIKRKGHSKPLIDTRELLDTIAEGKGDTYKKKGYEIIVSVEERPSYAKYVKKKRDPLQISDNQLDKILNDYADGLIEEITVDIK